MFKKCGEFDPKLGKTK